jgi:hypothetical protein
MTKGITYEEKQAIILMMAHEHGIPPITVEEFEEIVEEALKQTEADGLIAKVPGVFDAHGKQVYRSLVYSKHSN